MRKVQRSNIASQEFQVLGESLLASQTPRRRHEIGAEIDAGNVPGKRFPACDGSCRKPGPAAHVEHPRRAVYAHRVQVVTQHLGEPWVLSTGLEARNEGRKHVVVELVGPAERIDGRHGRTPSTLTNERDFPEPVTASWCHD